MLKKLKKTIIKVLLFICVLISGPHYINIAFGLYNFMHINNKTSGFLNYISDVFFINVLI